jgi:GAF domain-containing protein
VPPPPHIAAALVAAARTINQSRNLEETLDTVARVARDSIPGIDEVGISTLDRGGRIHTRAATGDLVWELDRLQYGLGEGPCVDTLHEAHVVAVPHIGQQVERWPRYVPAAVEAGLRAQMAMKLYLDDEGTLGTLNLYSTSSDKLDPEAEAILELFAAHAAIAMGNARERDNLNEALNSRKVIGQAIGIICERYGLNEDRAFAFLVRASSTGNVKLRDIAQEIVDQRNAASQPRG